MSIIANNNILIEMREKIKDAVTCTVMDEIMNALADVLGNYEITQNIVEDTGKDFLVDAYLNALRVEGRSELTLERYEREIKRFLKVAGTTTRNITQYHIRKYLSDEKERGLADSTIKGLCWVMSGYFNWMHRDGILQNNPMGNIRSIKVQKKVKQVFSDIDIEKLKSNCRTLRDKAIVSFLQSTACRISEVTNLNIDNIDFANNECIVLGKGNKERIVYMDNVTAMYLKQYLSGRKDNDQALFLGLRKNRLTPNGVRVMLKTLARRSGIEHVHPHKFRRTTITNLVTRGMPIEQVKFLAGHEKIDTTMGYIVTDQNNVKNNFQKYA